MRREQLLTTAVGLLAILIAGCATVSVPGASATAEDRFVSDLAALFSEAGANDARYLPVRGKPWLVFDQQAQESLADYPVSGDLKTRRAFLTDAVRRAVALGGERTRLELPRVPADRLGAFVDAHATPGDGMTPAARATTAYTAAVARLETRELATLDALGSTAALDAYRADLEGGIEQSIKTRGRTLRQLALLPLAPFVRLWMAMHVASGADKEVHGDFSDATLYLPPRADDSLGDPATLDEAQLLARYAPVIAVEHKAQTAYDPKADRFGEVQMTGADRRTAQPRIDVEHPTVYTYTEKVTLDGQPLTQLVYNFWFPERPRLEGGFDPEVGPTQGAIIRVTLNAAGEPVLYENVSSCGCYYKVFPNAGLEKLAAGEYGAPLARKRFVLENDVPRKIDVNMPNLVEATGRGQVVAAYTAGSHDVASVLPFDGAQGRPTRTYRLVPYEALENLPFQEGSISMFDEDGLVRSADRLEATLLAASGIYHAGTPRQRGTLMIYFDQADFDDPLLLPRYLRLPRGAFAANAHSLTLAPH